MESNNYVAPIAVRPRHRSGEIPNLLSTRSRLMRDSLAMRVSAATAFEAIWA
jgi:hypothetical protein